MTSVPQIDLNNGRSVPQLGFGVFQIPADATKQAVLQALEIGYRHIDTAQMYGNEAQVGQAVRESGLDRSELFVTSKLNNGAHRPDEARSAFDSSLKALDIGYLDLFLIHWPLPGDATDYVDTWATMQEFSADGRARSIGVSNFQPAHLERLRESGGTTPAVNQIEVHPYFRNEAVRGYGSEHAIVTQAWSPIAQGTVLSDPIVSGVAGRLGVTPAQAVLRWHVQRGDVVFPKSASAERMAKNFDIFGFELTASDMAAIDGLDRAEAGRMGPHPDKLGGAAD